MLSMNRNWMRIHSYFELHKWKTVNRVVNLNLLTMSGTLSINLYQLIFSQKFWLLALRDLSFFSEILTASIRRPIICWIRLQDRKGNCFSHLYHHIWEGTNCCIGLTCNRQSTSNRVAIGYRTHIPTWYKFCCTILSLYLYYVSHFLLPSCTIVLKQIRCKHIHWNTSNRSCIDTIPMESCLHVS